MRNASQLLVSTFKASMNDKETTAFISNAERNGRNTSFLMDARMRHKTFVDAQKVHGWSRTDASAVYLEATNRHSATTVAISGGAVVIEYCPPSRMPPTAHLWSTYGAAESFQNLRNKLRTTPVRLRLLSMKG